MKEHQIRTAIKAYLDAGGDSEFYIVSKKSYLLSLRTIISKVREEVFTGAPFASKQAEYQAEATFNLIDIGLDKLEGKK